MWLDYFPAEDVYLALANIKGGLAYGSATGANWWVDSTATTSEQAGTFHEPFLTIDAAINACTAAVGDVILVKPGHTEDLDAAGTPIDLDVEGVSIIGLGHGQFRPKITYSDTGAYVEVNASGCRISNIWFENQVNTLGKFMNLTSSADGFRLTDCLFTTSDTAYEVTDLVVVTSPDDAVLARNRFAFDGVDTCGTCINVNDAAIRLTIAGNYIHGDFGASDAVGAIEVTGTGVTGLLIVENEIYAEQNEAGGAINIDPGAGNTTGIIARNGGYCANATAIDNDNCACFENYFADGTAGIDHSGTLDPA